MKMPSPFASYVIGLVSATVLCAVLATIVVLQLSRPSSTVPVVLPKVVAASAAHITSPHGTSSEYDFVLLAITTDDGATILRRIIYYSAYSLDDFDDVTDPSGHIVAAIKELGK